MNSRNCTRLQKYFQSKQAIQNAFGTSKSNAIFRRSIFVVKDMKKGEVFNKDNIRSIRPGVGLKPKFLEEIIGKKASMDLERGEPLSWEKIIK